MHCMHIATHIVKIQGGERLAENTLKMKFLPVVVEDDLVVVFSVRLFLVIALCSLYGEGKGGE